VSVATHIDVHALAPSPLEGEGGGEGYSAAVLASGDVTSCVSQEPLTLTLSLKGRGDQREP
jgi:hypothetical protein